MNKSEQGWSVPIAIENIPDAGGRYEISADRSAREAVAKLAGLRDLPRLEAVFDVTKQSNGIAVIGEVNARVGQNCVVTLEPIESDLREAVDLLFAPPEAAPREKRAKAKGEPPETLESDAVDLGAIATEFLMLGLDPYPRKPGVAFAQPKTEKGADAPHPFAGLEALKKRG